MFLFFMLPDKFVFVVVGLIRKIVPRCRKTTVVGMDYHSRSQDVNSKYSALALVHFLHSSRHLSEVEIVC